jgi:hypothetical protein
MQELFRLRELLFEAIFNKGEKYSKDNKKLSIVDKICIELIKYVSEEQIKIREIRVQMGEMAKQLNIYNAKQLASLDFSTLFPSLGFTSLPNNPKPFEQKKPQIPAHYITLKQFMAKHPKLICLTESRRYFHQEFKDSSVKSSRSWFVDEEKFLEFLFKKELYKDRMLARREKYASLLSL